jgi:hypothetical protein
MAPVIRFLGGGGKEVRLSTGHYRLERHHALREIKVGTVSVVEESESKRGRALGS